MATEYYYYLGQQLQALAGAMFHAGDQQTAIAEQQTVIADQQTVIARLQEEVELVKNRADAAVEVAASAVSVTAKALKELEDETTRADAAELDSHIARCRTLEAPPPLTLDDIEAYVLTGSGFMCQKSDPESETLAISVVTELSEGEEEAAEERVPATPPSEDIPRFFTRSGMTRLREQGGGGGRNVQRRISFQPTADSPASPLLFSPAAQWPTPGTFSP